MQNKVCQMNKQQHKINIARAPKARNHTSSNLLLLVLTILGCAGHTLATKSSIGRVENTFQNKVIFRRELRDDVNESGNELFEEQIKFSTFDFLINFDRVFEFCLVYGKEQEPICDVEQIAKSKFPNFFPPHF